MIHSNQNVDFENLMTDVDPTPANNTPGTPPENTLLQPDTLMLPKLEIPPKADSIKPSEIEMNSEPVKQAQSETSVCGFSSQLQPTVQLEPKAHSKPQPEWLSQPQKPSQPEQTESLIPSQPEIIISTVQREKQSQLQPLVSSEPTILSKPEPEWLAQPEKPARPEKLMLSAHPEIPQQPVNIQPQPEIPNEPEIPAGQIFWMKSIPSDLRPLSFRLIINNLPIELNEEKLVELVESALVCGDQILIDCFVDSEKSFALLDFNARQAALRVKDSLDGSEFHGRVVSVRLAAHKAKIWVGKIPRSLSNENLGHAFSRFGAVERALVVTNDRGKSEGWGFVEFAQKRAAARALEMCTRQMFMLAGNTPPVEVRAFEERDTEDGVRECKMKRTDEMREEISTGSHFVGESHPNHATWRTFADLCEEHDGVRRALQDKHDEARTIMLREIVTTIREETQKRIETEREREQEQWKIFQQKRIEFERTQRELAELQRNANASGPSQPFTRPFDNQTFPPPNSSPTGFMSAAHGLWTRILTTH